MPNAPSVKDTTTDNAGKGEASASLASIRDVYSFGEGKFWLVAGGLFCSAVTGCVFPVMVFIFATSFQEIGGSTSQADFFDGVRGVAFNMMELGYVTCSRSTVHGDRALPPNNVFNSFSMTELSHLSQ